MNAKLSVNFNVIIGDIIITLIPFDITLKYFYVSFYNGEHMQLIYLSLKENSLEKSLSSNNLNNSNNKNINCTSYEKRFTYK